MEPIVDQVEAIKLRVKQWREEFAAGDTRGSIKALEDIEVLVNAEPPPAVEAEAKVAE